MAAESMQDLITEGVLKCYIDLRSGVYYDWSRSGNEGSPSGITLGYNGGTFDTANSNIIVADALSLQGTEGCLGILANEFTGSLDRYLYKRDSGGTQYGWTRSGGDLFFYDGSISRSLTADLSGVRGQAVNFKTGETPEGFADGLPIGSYSGTVTITADTADLYIGNDYLNAAVFDDTLQAVWYVSRKLTDEEQLAIYNDVLNTDFGTTTAFQEGDVDLFQTVDDGDISVTGGITRMTGRLATAAYLAMFGGNEDDPGGGDTTYQWWGNIGETDPAKTYRSETQYLLRNMPNTSENRIKLEQAVLRDLEFFKDIDTASSIQVQTIVPQRNRIDITVDIQALGQRDTFRYVNNWEAPQ
jgi:hypothetical protein